MSDHDPGEEVEVDQPALMNILARYPGSFDVLRELIQNADDAEANNIEVHYLTRGVEKSQPASELDVVKPNVRKWIIKNDGTAFGEKDWERLGRIAKGNDNATKVGAFGVGFYSVLSKSDRPFVRSGGKSLQFCRGRDGKLRKQSDGCSLDSWTSIELELRDPEPLPLLDDLTRFLVSSLAFLVNICTISICLEGEEKPLRIRKETRKESAVNILIPEHLRRTTSSKTLTVDSIWHTVQKITIDAPEWAFPSSSAPTPSPDESDDTLIERSGRSGANNLTRTPRTTDTILEENAITHDLYTATTHVELHPESEMKKGVESCLKSLPTSFECKAVYFNSEQYNSLPTVHDSHSLEAKRLAGLFWGPQGIVPEKDSGRLFIGQSTNQTTGIGLHISAHFLPTMERGSIDLANGHVAAWNKEVLCVSAFLARIIYEKEMHHAKSKDKLGTKLGLSTMARFAFGSTSPHSQVSQILQDAFFACCLKPKSPFPVVSEAGISCASDSRFRQCNKDLSFLKTYLVLHEEVEERQHSQIIARYKIPQFKYGDIIQEFEFGVPQDLLKSFFRWWEDAKKNDSDEAKRAARDRFCQKFPTRGVLRSSNKDKIVLKAIKSFTFFSLPNDLCPPDNLYIDNTQGGVPSKGAIECFGWTQLSLVKWLQYARSQRQHASNQADMDYRILRVLVQFALVEDLSRQWNQVTELVKDLRCVPTNQGLLIPAEAYFHEADVCNILPVVVESSFSDIQPVPDERGFLTKPVDREHIRKVLDCIRVRQVMDWEDMVAKLKTNASEESNYRLLRHLLRLKFGFVRGETLTDRHINDLKQRPVFYSQGHDGVSATELHSPDEDIRKLGLPILDLSQECKAALQSIADQFDPFEVGVFLKSLGIREYPTLKNVIAQAASKNQEVQRSALRYLLSNLDKRYNDYKPDDFAGVAFIPTTRGTLACPNEVFASSEWEKLGFHQVSETLCRDRSRLGVKDDPSVDMIIKRFESPKDTLPDLKTACTWFEQLCKYGKLPILKLREQFATISFVPVERPGVSPSEPTCIEYLPPKECFILSTDTKKHYRGVFPFVDFGPNGNNFLESCCAKKSPDAPDIARKILQDPEKYLNDLQGDTNLYLEDLRTIASRLDLISEDDKQKMKTKSMFLASCKHVDDGVLKLLPADQVVVGDWESRRFGDTVFLAPKDDTLEKMYCEMGSQFLGTYVRHEIIANGHKAGDNPPFQPDYVIPRIRCFMKQRDKSGRKDEVSFYEKGSTNSFRVNVCKTLAVKKTFAPPFRIFTGAETARKIEIGPFPFNAGFEVDEDGESYTLWMGKGPPSDAELRNNIAVALCHGLLKTFGPNDVLLLASLFTMDDNHLKQYYGDDIMGELPRAPNPIKVKVKIPLPFAPLSRFVKPTWVSSLTHVRITGEKIVSGPLEDDVNEAVRSLGKVDPEAPSPDFTTRSKQPTTSHQKHSSHCKHAHTIKLRENKILQDEKTRIRFFFSTDAQCISPPRPAIQEFAELISNLARVFGQEPSTFCFMFWKDTDGDLMAFNRDQRYIFFNLAHYHDFFYKKDKEPKDMVTEWYLIMAHEIAHNKTPEHDEYHGSLSAKIAVDYLPTLHRSFPCFAENA